ncbi:MAG: hypothetical protein QF441_04345 [Bacteriovoracaceae bacterium]|jgi:hypothetical protein|nr:hypothetical protein [Halobacteriovoraceae bacterium]MDP7319811.1 hypothetical protein [Bacteriovoracaceae bacterium]
MNNQNGQAAFLGLVLLTLLSLQGSLYLKKRLIEIKQQKEKQQALLCSKEVNGMTKSLIQQFHHTNKMLKWITIGKYISYASLILPPPLKLLMSIIRKNGKHAAKYLKKFQRLKAFSYVNYIRFNLRRKCSFSFNISKTPYKYRKNRFKRDHLNQAKLRKKKWHIYTQKGNYQIKTQVNVRTRKIHSTLKKARVLWRGR